MDMCPIPAKQICRLPWDFKYLGFGWGHEGGWRMCRWRLIQTAHGQVEAGVPHTFFHGAASCFDLFTRELVN